MARNARRSQDHTTELRERERSNVIAAMVRGTPSGF